MPELSATIADVTETNANNREGPEPPARLITANQVAAWNLARYRRSAGLTQHELGTLIGWTEGAVSDAERSWRGGRVREFDAQALTLIAFALGVPVLALLLPPDVDGPGERLEIDAGPEHGRVGMGRYLTDALLPDGPVDGDDNRALDEYGRRYARSADAYISDPETRARAVQWLHGGYSHADLADLAARLRRHQAAAADAVAFSGELAEAIEKELEAGEA